MPPEYRIYVPQKNAAGFESAIAKRKGVEVLTKRVSPRDGKSPSHPVLLNDELARNTGLFLKTLATDTPFSTMRQTHEYFRLWSPEWREFSATLPREEEIAVANIFRVLSYGNHTIEDVRRMLQEPNTPLMDLQGIGYQRFLFLQKVFQDE